MLRGVARLSLRRGIHTSRPVNSAVGLSRYRFGMAACASVIGAASYLGWRIGLGSRGIALDSDNNIPRPKPTLAQSSEILSAPPPSDASESQVADLVDEKADDGPSPLEEEEGEGEEGEEESSSAGGAFDPVTGKINWDCPCLGGMAYGPCGMQFREAFSCFVFSEQEPKGIDCVEKFKAMQDCFRENPDVYGDEILNDDDDEDGESPAPPPPSPSSGDAPAPAPAPAPSATLPAESPSKQVSQ
ncbi:hypothetical protein F5888DRAFT_1729744 [Russula emetica]|nr:hypothetical protein F5888DRAFT_1729744 [Russula emetica]